jgi:hypothetical protein
MYVNLARVIFLHAFQTPVVNGKGCNADMFSGYKIRSKYPDILCGLPHAKLFQNYSC